MKKISLSLIILVGMLPLVTKAQSDDAFDRFRFGTQLSPTISWLSSDNSKVLNGGAPNIGLKLGLNGEYQFAKNYSLGVGLGFGFNQAGKLQFPEGGDILPKSELENIDPLVAHDLPKDTKVNYKVNYLEIPISLKFRTKEYGYIKYYAELPIITFGARIGAKANIDATNIDVTKQNIKKDVVIQSLQWGLGGGAEYYLSEDNALIFGVYYNQGIFDVTKKNGNNNDKALSHNITLRLGILF